MQIAGYATWQPSGKTGGLQVVRLIEWRQGTKCRSLPIVLMDVVDLVFIVIGWSALFEAFWW